jgi:O-antigen ligase
VKIDFPLRDYIPHNQVLWLLVKMGAVGFCLFWFFLNSFACGSTLIVRSLRDPYLKAVGTVAIAAIVNQIVVSHYDLQLTYYRNMVFLGTLMGLIPAISSIDRKGEDHERTTVRTPD